MPLYTNIPTPIRGRSIADIYNGRLHSYSALYHRPYNPYSSGALRNIFRTSSIRRKDSAEHDKKSEAEIEKEQKKEDEQIEQDWSDVEI